MALPVLAALSIAQSLNSSSSSAPTTSGGSTSFISSAVSKVGGLIGSLFGGGDDGPTDPTGDGGIANATAINQQRDVVLNSEIFKYYEAQGKFEPGFLHPPAWDAFGGTAAGNQVLSGLARVIEDLKTFVKSEPVVQKYMYAVDKVYADYQSIGGIFGPMTGSGNVPEAIRNLNNVLRIVAEEAAKDPANAPPAVPVIATPSPIPAQPGTAPTGDISALSNIFQSVLAASQAQNQALLEAVLNRAVQPQPPVPTPAIPEPAAAGFDISTFQKIGPIIATLLIVGFIFSDFGLKSLLGKK